MVNILQKKIFRDIRENWWPFLAIVCICSLGIALFSGINLYITTMEDAVSNYYEQNKLADYWVYKTDITEQDIQMVQNISGVQETQRRRTLETSVLTNTNSTLLLHAVEGKKNINIPELLEGNNLDGTETNALLLDSRFAEENGIKPGDIIPLSLDSGQKDWLVKGIVRNVEYIYFAPDGIMGPDYKNYGFAYMPAEAIPDLPYNELVITLDENADFPSSQIMASIREALGGSGVNVISRSQQSSSRFIIHDIEGVKQLSIFFPIVFFSIAALVTWITMSRMMENQRQHLGTLRSIGYFKNEILGRYTVYGLIITIPSAIIGLLIAKLIVANPLYDMGIKYYTMETNGVKSFSVHYWAAVLCVIAVTCGASYFSGRKALQLMPSTLMRPNPPAQGHRILLEKITPVWNRINFSGKIIARNLFRNKVRMLMGVLGTIGSIALILCGFGMMDSMDRTIEKHFDGSLRYDAKIKLKTTSSYDEIMDMINSLNADSVETAMVKGAYVYEVNGNTQNPYLVIFDDIAKSINFYDEKRQHVELPDEGILITPRMSRALHVNIGDTISVELMDGMELRLDVAGIVDVPVGNEIFISKAAYEKYTSIPYGVGVLFVSGNNLDLDGVANDPRISSVETKNGELERIEEVLSLLGSVQLMLIVFAAILAFSVMMVLGQLNYHERIKELATLKVLGFYPKEMKRLVLRENIWITVIGVPFGVMAGSLLLRFILDQATTPDMEIHPQLALVSVLIGAVMMFGFTVFVNIVIGRKFKSIDMVASLKSVE